VQGACLHVATSLSAWLQARRIHLQIPDTVRDAPGCSAAARAGPRAGDFVDRGSFSMEVILTLLAWRVLLPGHLHLARGNHESKGMNMIYGFEGEARRAASLPNPTLRA
jgi:hypothetical protein